MLDNHTNCPPTTNRSVAVSQSCTNWCNKLPPPWSGVYPPAPTIGGQCSHNETLLPPSCDSNPRIAPCKATPGVARAYYNDNDEVGEAAAATCLTATQVAEGDSSSSASAACAGYTTKCVFFS